MPTVTPLSALTVLDFDLETVAAGFADPNWVPQKITCAAWSYVGSDRVDSLVCGPLGLYTEPAARESVVLAVAYAVRHADIVTGHNIARFDLPVLNSELMRFGHEPIRSLTIQDTIRVPRAKGFKKGQDNLARMLKVRDEKLPLDWQAWEDAYAEPGWPTVRRRCETDVVQHKQLRAELLARDLLKTEAWHA